MEMKERVLSIALVIAIGIIGTLGFGLLPLKAAGRLRCEAPFRGSDPKQKAVEGYLVGREAKACSDKGSSRTTIVLVVGVLYITFGIGAVVTPPSNFERMAFGGEDPEDVYEINR